MKKIALYTLAFISLSTSAFDEFLITDIRIIGLQRVSIGSIFTAIPVSVGDKMSQAKVREISKALFATAQFNDIQIAKDGNALIISLLERPSISSIELEGNKALKSEDLLKGLEGAGIAEGQVYKRSTLNGMKSELVRQYSSQGRYGASVNIETEDRPRNTLALKIIIDEGKSAKIKKVNIIGNNLFTDEELMTGFELQEGKWYAFLSNKDKYSKEKLEGDIENLESFYLDRGYLKFSIESSQVSVSKNKEDVFITLSISEGDQYKIDDVSVIGEMPLDEALYNPIVESQKNKIYSQAQITQIEEYFVNLLGNEGYTFAEVSGNPEINQENKTVSLLFLVQPGNRTYARKILFAGNYLTNDEVLRREMRQFEGAWASDNLIEGSKVRLERLGFFKEVNVETIPVPGTEDQVDIEFTVEEESTSSVGGSIGYSDFGMNIGLNLSDNNYLGSGNRFIFGINKSIYQESYNISFFDPYFTMDGVSRGYSIYFRETDYGEYNIANYLTNSQGLGVQFGYPISDTQRIGLNVNFDNTDIDSGSLPSREISDFLSSEGNVFDVLKAQAVWSRVTLNRGMFPTYGSSTDVMLQVTVPGSDLTYYKTNLRQKFYRPLGFSNLVFGFDGELGYIGAYGDTEKTPFFENFYSGGPRSIRGFESNTLGPRVTPSPCYDFDPVTEECPLIVDSDFDGTPDSIAQNPYLYQQRRDPIGGNLLIEGSLQLIFKLPMIEDQRSMRSAFFLDFGNVFSTDCQDYQINCFEPSVDELRYSIGVGVTWITGFGPMSFSFSQPFNDGIYDRTEEFQFTIGTVF
ncbi:MAG: outer membrane protein assembly factor BamA [SAR86 cluster bacterium]|uniref:Outer membrane protein assembly factor BamA n=1 Tax=SAR86 cluster bacterium TaxID=2030880 RepID=A0A838XU65_9GAMM|nr:outer membrane protein assembly factor BamA [SAR86 cluster bacterium]|tara:strand:- start:4315 stop:6726 length:2412 start_codon:yes stop_codon:yes gene_type:complete